MMTAKERAAVIRQQALDRGGLWPCKDLLADVVRHIQAAESIARSKERELCASEVEDNWEHGMSIAASLRGRSNS